MIRFRRHEKDIIGAGRLTRSEMAEALAAIPFGRQASVFGYRGRRRSAEMTR
jgi:hypothetical protein